MLATTQHIEDLAPVARRLAVFRCMPGTAQPLFGDWLVAHRETLFRWTMARCSQPTARRALAETAVAMQRLHGEPEFMAWLFGAALQAAADQAGRGGLREADLVGLAPELRTVLRLTSRGDCRQDDALAMLTQGLNQVRGRLLQARLRA